MCVCVSVFATTDASQWKTWKSWLFMAKMRIQMLVGAKPTLFHNIISKKNGTQNHWRIQWGGWRCDYVKCRRKHLLRKHHRHSHLCEKKERKKTSYSENRKIVNDWWKRTENLLQIKDIRIHLCVVILRYAFVFLYFSPALHLKSSLSSHSLTLHVYSRMHINGNIHPTRWVSNVYSHK